MEGVEAMASTTKESEMVGILERMLVEGFAQGNVDVVDELCSPDVVEHQFGLGGSGADALAKLTRGIADVHRAFPDVRFEIADSSVSGDTVWVRAEATATNTGPFFGQPPTGLPVSWTVIDVARIENGRIVEHWGVPDRFEILVRLGRITPPSPGAAAA
jgi:predicted ester cyclase